MKLVGSFLSRFQNITPPNDSLKDGIVRALHNTLDIKCSKEKISISRGVAYVKVSSVAKNIIQINRSKVLQSLFDDLPKARDSVRDIR